MQYIIKCAKGFHKGLMLTLAALTLALTASAQSKITGRVVDENGQPAIGANIIVSGTTQGASADIEGRFTLTVKANATLVVSYLGYQTQEIKVGTRTDFQIRLQPEANIMDEVVVVGYGSTKRSDLTGSISSVSAKNIEGYQSGSVLGALSGQVAGVQITTADGTPGAGFDIKIRGIGTVNGDAAPLYIVDGFQVDNIDYLSGNDIEQVDMLKDASAAAIYGARAANGVVLVTTKSGKIGRPTVTYNGSASYRQISKTLDLLNNYEFAKFQQESGFNTYWREGTDSNGKPYRYQTAEDYLKVPGIDWQNEVFRPTWSQDHNVALSGGTENTRYSVSFSDYLENGIFNNSGFNKVTGKMTLNQKVTKWLTADVKLTYANTEKRGIGTSGDQGRFNMLGTVLRSRPTGGLLMSDYEMLHTAVDPLVEENTSGNLAQVNPIIQTESVTNKKRTEQWIANLGLTFRLGKKWTLKTTGTYNVANYRQDIFYHEQSRQAISNNAPYGSTQMGRDMRWSNSNLLTYRMGRKAGHSLEVLIGQENSGRTTEYLKGTAMDFPFDNLGNNNLGLGAKPTEVTSNYAESMLVSFFTRVNYNYRDRYFFDATLRADGSTVFSDGNKWGVFPAFSAAWRISEEKFMKNQRTISNLKLRLGWGQVGNDRITNYLSLMLYSKVPIGIGTDQMIALQPKQLANDELRWEASQSTNLGIDFGLFDNRLSMTADFFIKDTKDLLMNASIPGVTGFTSQWQNIGKIRNKGIELSITSTNFDTRGGFRWTTNFNISFIRNELRALASGEQSRLFTSGWSADYVNDYIAQVGSSLGDMYGYVFDGIYQSDDFVWNEGSGKLTLREGVVDMSDNFGSTFGPGCVKYKDIDGDGKITTADRTKIGNGTPLFFGGITNTFNYKGFDLSFMFQFNYGNDVYNATRLYGNTTMEKNYNMMAEVAGRWTETNASNSVPKYNGYIKNEVYSRFIEDGSFLRLKNLTFGYTLPQKLTRKIYVSKLRLYFSAQNLFVVTGYSGYDPEVSVASSSPTTPALDWGAYPKSRVFTFGIDLTL
ncbi:SusC/RagA family TonB-linked outer membrane protein [Alistipes sp. An66]|uniref:SusC/RagA family TonB-linked outer membrane protein n=1 Tax=Alistipes sp. An66 TaxID=1965650 RepID=UPI000B370D12|nr:TonB-dependent receptor [Alistipes sp. An66]OUN59129.1 SusC/RagA family TonB-linked outer membrane protein [Alistipes sp. An66]